MDPIEALEAIRDCVGGSDYAKACELFEELDASLQTGACPWHSEKYQGWANRETYEAFQQLYSKEDLWITAKGLVSLGTDVEAADALREWLTDLCSMARHRYMACAIGSLWRVDWTALVRDMRVN